MARKSASASSVDVHVKELVNAKKFVRKNFRTYGSGISFNSSDGSFDSYANIEMKHAFVDSVEDNPELSFWPKHEQLNISMNVTNGVMVDKDNHIVNILDRERLSDSIKGCGIGDWKDGLSTWHVRYEHQKQMSLKHGEEPEADCFASLLDYLKINEDEFVGILCDLYLDTISRMIDRSIPVAQKAYDRWVEKGCVATKRKERIASTFGDAFVKALVDGICSFHDEYVRIETESEIIRMRTVNAQCHRELYKESEIRERAEKSAEESWKLWSRNEEDGIIDILLRYDAGKCETFEIHFDKSTMTVDGDIYGDTGKRLNFHTIFAGGYNIQKLHTRTIAHVFDK